MKNYEDVIINFLKKSSDKLINIKILSIGIKVSYPTTLREVYILQAQGKIRIEDFGHHKLLYLVDKNI